MQGVSSLQKLLRAREDDAQRLQQLLAERDSLLAGRQARIAEQANFIGQLEERIRQLLQQLEQQQQKQLDQRVASRGEVSEQRRRGEHFWVLPYLSGRGS